MSMAENVEWYKVRQEGYGERGCGVLYLCGGDVFGLSEDRL